MISEEFQQPSPFALLLELLRSRFKFMKTLIVTLLLPFHMTSMALSVLLSSGPLNTLCWSVYKSLLPGLPPSGLSPSLLSSICITGLGQCTTALSLDCQGPRGWPTSCSSTPRISKALQKSNPTLWSILFLTSSSWLPFSTHLTPTWTLPSFVALCQMLHILEGPN